MENIFDQIDDEVSAPAASTLVRGQENLFDEFDNDPPPADLGPNSSTHLKSTPGPLPAWQQQMIDGVSISNAREAAKVLTKAERDNPRMEAPEESASFFGAFQNGLGPQNYAAFADMLDHLGDMRGDKGMHDWADGIRKSLEEDKSSYKAIYQSYKQIRGLSSAWDYAKESAGQMLGVMTPSLAGGFMGGLGGGAIGSRLGGKTGAAVGGAMGGIAGAASGSIHLHVSEMRGALKREGMEGENLVDYTNYGAAVLASLDALFPGLAMARVGGFARKKLAEGVASKLAENLAKGGKLATIAEFNKQFGKQLAKDTLLEVTTELAQQAVTDLGAKRLAGKEITKGDLEKFAYETAPEIALRTAIGTAFVGAGPSAIQAGKTLSDTRAKAQAEQQSPGDRKADKLVTDQGDVVDPAEAPPPAPVDGTPAVDELAAQQPAVEDASREAPAPAGQRQKGDSVLRFIRDSGGLQPSGELDALDARRYPGLINENGLTADQMREALIENGYLEETGPDTPSVTTPQDVYDLVQRAISGERIVPLADQKADDAHFSGPDDGDARRALLQNEKQFVLPQIEQYDEEFGEPVLAKVYRGLKEDDRLEVIDRVRRGEDVADLLEEVSMREADVEALQEMTAKRGPDPQVVERIREMIAQQQPDLLTGFDEVVAAMPARRPRAARGSLNLREGEHPGDRSMAELMQMSKAELSSAAARSGVPARPNWSKERIAGELRAAAARRLTPEPARELKMGEMPDKPAIPVKFSVTPAAIVSLIDGSKHTDIRPHLKQRGVTLEQYARQFDLPPDYPVLAPNEVDRRYDAVRTTVSDDEFAKQFTIGADLAPNESAGEAEAAPQPERPQRDTAAEFLRLLAGKTPRAQWASSLGVTEKELKPHIDRALAKGFLRRDRNGVIRRNPGVLKEFEPETEIVNQKIERAVEQGAAAMVAPGRIEGTEVAMTPAAIDKAAEIKGVVTRALAGILPRDVRVDVVDTIEIGRLAREDELLSLAAAQAMTRDAAFKRWFGDSKVVDAEGKPLIVYHGTNQDFEAFSRGVGGRNTRSPLGRRGIFFTADSDVANEYAAYAGRNVAADPAAHKARVKKYVSEANAAREAGDDATFERLRADFLAYQDELNTDVVRGQHVVPAYLSIKNPLVVDGSEFVGNAQENMIAALDRAKEAGHDGAIFRNVEDAPDGGSTDVYVVFEPTQIKSAIGNRGTFDPADPRIAYSLRSSKSATVDEGTEGESDGVQKDSGDSGKARDDKSEPADAGAIAAAVGGGDAPGSSAAEGRILRQESATLRDDGSIRAGRISGKARGAVSRGRNAEALQPVGATEFFDAPGFRGVVTAGAPADHALLDRRGAPPSEYRLATLTYRLYDENAPMTEAQLKNFQPNFRAGGEFHAPLIWARVSQHMDGTWEVSMIQRIAAAGDAPRGMSSKLYAAIEADLGIRMSPSGILSKEGMAMWQKRSPESVKWHQWSKHEQYFISPRRIKDRIPEVSKQVKFFAARMAENPSDTQVKVDWDGARKERGELIKLWGQLPLEARAATPNMFSLRGFFSPAIRAAESISMKKGTGEQFLKQITKVPGVRKDELEWMGLEEFLKGKPSVTRDEVLSFMRAHQVELDEKILGTDASLKVDRSELSVEKFRQLARMDEDEFSDEDVTKIERLSGGGKSAFVVSSGNDDFVVYDGDGEAFQQTENYDEAVHIATGILHKGNEAASRFSGYKVPGGESYRELLIRLPHLGVDPQRAKAIQKRLDEIVTVDDTALEHVLPENVDEVSRLRRELEPTYVSRHFQDQEIVHLRVDDRTGPNGEKVLFINEVQSDLHQAGRQKGYQGEGESLAQMEERRSQLDQEQNALVKEFFGRGAGLRADPRWQALDGQQAELSAIIRGKLDAPPQAPFKGDLWLELALKRALLYASENGYDAISWARSDQIAKAVGASFVNEIKWRTTDDGIHLSDNVRDDNGKGVVRNLKWGKGEAKAQQPTQTIAQMYGEDIAAQVRSAIERGDSAGEIGGLNLPNVGMHLQYDQKIGRFLRDYTKKWGAKVEEENLGVADAEGNNLDISLMTDEQIADAAASLHATNPILRITPEMRASVMEGQPLALRGREDTGQLEALGQTDLYSQTISIAVRAIEAEARRTGKSMVKVAIQAGRHEALEFFQGIGLIRPQEWANLRAAAIAENWIDETGVREAYTAKYGSVLPPAELEELILKEAVMEKYGAYERGEFAPKGIVRKVMERVKNFLQSVMNGLRGLGFERWEDIFQKVDAGELRKRYEAIYGERKAAPVTASGATTASPQPMIRAGQTPDARGQTPTPGQVGEVKGIAELIDEFKRAIGLTARTGRLDPGLKRAAKQAGGELLGQYNGVARTKIQGDIDILTHEGGHHLERTLGADLAAIMQANQAELTPLATASGNPPSEGFAEFFRRYVTNPTAAAARAPGFFRDFEDLLDANNPEMLERLQSIQREYDRFLLGDPVEQGIANQTVVKRTQNAFSKGLSDIERDGFVSTIGDRLHTLYYNLISQNHGWWIAVRDLLGDIEARTGQRISLAAKDNPNKLIRMISHTAAWAQQDLKDGIALRGRPNGGGVSMHQVLATAFGGTDKSQWNERATQEFGEYLIARRAIHQYVRFRPAFRQQIQQFVAANPSLAFILQRLPNNLTPELERPPTKESLTHQLMKLKALEERQPQFRQAAELYYAFNRDIIRFLHEKQLITKEERDEYLRDRDYAPFQRDMSDKEPARGEKAASKRPGRAADTVNKNDVYRRFEGSMRDIINPIQSTSQLVYEMRLRAAINDTLLAMDRLADQAGPAGKEIFERVPAHEAKAMHVNMREALRQAAKAAGMSPTDTAVMLTNVEGQIGQNVVTTMFTQQKAGERGERIVWFYKDGEAVPAQIADGELGRMMFEGLTAVGQRNMGLLMSILATGATIVRAGVTRSFGFIFRNIFTDSIAAMINSRYASKIPLKTQISGMREILGGGKYHQMYNRYAGMLGGETTQALSDQSIERDIMALRRKGFHIRRPESIRDFLKMVFQIGEFSETATRVGIFRNAMKSAVADGMTEFDAAIEAAHYAHDVMDFSKHGSKTEAIRRVIPFLNAIAIGMDKYARTMNAANDYNTLMGIWWRRMNGLPLSENEKRASADAARAWAISTLGLGAFSLFLCFLNEGDDDIDEIPEEMRATHWRVSIDGLLYLLPKDWNFFLTGGKETDVNIRLPRFEFAWFAAAVERAYDGAKKGDPTAFEGWLSDMWSLVAPPASIPGADVFYGWRTGTDPRTGRAIIPIYETGQNQVERSLQFGPYTSQTAKKIGETLNISPYYVDYLVRGLGASSAREAQSVLDAFSGKGPAPSIADYPVAQRFTFNAGRSSKSLMKFHDMMADKEGLNSWFWDSASSDARGFHSAANTYGDYKKANNEAGATEFLRRINPDQRVFAVLSKDFEKGKAKLRNLHPMINANEAIQVANDVMREVVDGTLVIGKKGEERKPLSREEMRFARNEIGHIRKGVAQNALRTLEIEGWAQQKLMDVDARIATLKAGAPEVHAELMRRLKARDVQKFSHIAQVWPEVKRRVLQDKGEAQISDLAYGKVEGY